MKLSEKQAKEMCDSCGKNPANEPDTYPYRNEINEDESLCNCCNECREDCFYQI